MKRIAALSFILGSLLAAGVSGAPSLKQETPNEGRVPTKDPKQMYPRWHPFVVPDAFLVGSPATIDSSMRQPSLAVDSRNIVHIVGSHGFSNDIRYSNNSFATRQGDGFSSSQIIDSPSGNINFSNPDIGIGPNPEDLHVVFERKDFSSGNQDVFYTQFLNGTWTIPVTLTAGTPPGGSGYSYFSPQIAVDSNNVVHVTANHVLNGFGNPKTIVYLQPNQPFFTLPDSVGGDNPQIAVSPTNDLHVAWETSGGVFYKARISGAWGTTESAGAGHLPDLAVSVPDNPQNPDDVHFCWTSGGGIVQYVKRTNGSFGSVENVSQFAVSETGGTRIVVDSRRQPHVVWEGINGFSYAGRVNHPGVQGGPDKWVGRQEAVQDHKGFGTGQTAFPREFAIDDNDQMYVIGRGRYNEIPLYTRSIEYNLGAQDEFGTFPVAPNTTANLVNGNVLFTLPLFTSNGAGLSTSMSLIYNSLETYPSTISQGWIHNYHMYLTDSRSGVHDQAFLDPSASSLPADVITLFLPDGQSVAFRWRGTGEGVEMAHLAQDNFGYFSRIDRTSSSLVTSYVMTTKFGVEYSFDSRGRLTEIKDLNDNTLTLTYSGPSGELSTVTDTMNRGTSLTYTVDGQLEKITDPGDREYMLEYDADGKLEKVTLNSTSTAPPQDNEKPVWQFDYFDADDAALQNRVNFLSQIVTPRGNTHSLFYYLDNRFQGSEDPQLTINSVNETDPGSESIDQHPRQVVNYFDPADPNGIPDDPVPARPRAEFTNRRLKTSAVHFQLRRNLVTKAVDPLGKFVKRTFDVNLRNVKSTFDKENNETKFFYTHEEGTKEKPAFVKDNLRRIESPAVNDASGGAGASVDAVRYVYVDHISLVSEIDTPNPTGAATYVKTKYFYDGHNTATSKGNLERIEYPSTTNKVTGGQVSAEETFQYLPGAPLGRIQFHTSSIVGVTEYQYNDPATGLVTGIRQPDHAKFETFKYDAMGNRTEHLMPENSVGSESITVYDGLYRVKEEQQPPGQSGTRAKTTFKYDLDSNVTRIDHPNLGFTEHKYDELGRLHETTQKKDNVINVTSSFRYDPEGNTRKSTDAEMNVRITLYTDRGEVFKERVPGPPTVETTFTYTDRGDVLTRKVNADTTTFTYTARGPVSVTTHSGGNLSDENQYQVHGGILSTVRKAGAAFDSGTGTAYDQRGRVVESFQLDSAPTGGTLSGLSSKFGLDGNGNRTEFKDATIPGRVFVTQFDKANRSVKSFNAGGILIAQTDYDDSDRTTARHALDPISGGGLVQMAAFTYTDRNEVETETDILTNVTAFVYLLNGEIDTRTDPDGTVTKFEYNFLSMTTKEVRDFGGLGIETQFGYDDNGNRETITDPRNFTYTFTFDASNRMRGLIYPSGNSEGWTYDSKGRMATHTDTRGVVETMEYDSVDRLSRQLYTLGVGGPTLADVQMSYDGWNLVETVDLETGIAVRHVDDSGNPGYDAFDRMTDSRVLFDVTTPLGAGTLWKDVEYEYFEDGQRKTYTDPEGQVFEYDYDGEGRLETITRTDVDPDRVMVSFFYDDSGRREEVLLANGTNVVWVYDQKGRVENIRAANSQGTTLSCITRKYDERDNVIERSYDHMGGKVVFGYDALSRLTSEAWTGGGSGGQGFMNQFTSQAPGNESTPSNVACATPLSQILSFGSYWAIYEYDGAGNRTLKQTSAGSASYSYDSDNRLTSETQESLQKATPNSVSAPTTDTGAGYGTSAITDGSTADGTDPSSAWKSTLASPHTVALDLGGTPVDVAQVRMFFPSDRLPTRFKVEYWDGASWVDFDVEAVTGAAPAAGAPGYWSATNRDVRMGFVETSATQVRLNQDAGGGSASEPQVAYLNEMDAWINAGPVTVTYDYTFNGQAGKSPNIQKRTQGSQIEEYSYDYKSRMVGYLKHQGDPQNPDTDFSYTLLPANDQRLNKFNNAAGATDNEEWYFSDGTDVSNDYVRTTGQTPAGQYPLAASYVRGTSIDSNWVKFEPGGGEFYYLPDGLGSVHRVIDDLEEVKNTYLTTAWGENHPGFSDIVNEPDRLGFTQRERDMESSLMYFRARGYDPRTGRFLQNDPVRGNRPWEHYVYASNNPETFTDPSGMQSQGPAITGGGSGPEVMRDDHGRPVIILFPSGDANVIVNFGPAGPLESGAELLGLRRGARFHPDASIVTFSVPNGDPRLVDIALLALEASNWEMNVQEFQYLTLHRGLSKHPVLTGYHERAWQQIAAAASPLTQAKDLQAHRAFARGDDATRLRIRNITAAASENLIASEGGRRSGGSPSSLHASQAGKGANRRAKDRTRAGGRTREGDELEEQNQRERVRKAQQKRNEAGRKTVNKFLREAKKRQQQMTQLREFKEHPPKPPTPPPADSP